MSGNRLPGRKKPKTRKLPNLTPKFLRKCPHLVAIRDFDGIDDVYMAENAKQAYEFANVVLEHEDVQVSVCILAAVASTNHFRRWCENRHEFN